MTNKEAIEVLQSMKSDFPLPKAAQTRRAQNDALDVAIEALKAEPCENAMLKEIATELVKEIKEDLIITDFSGNTRTITATKAVPNVPGAPPVYAVSAGDVIENREALAAVPLTEPEVRPINYRDCSNAMLRMWMDNVVTDGEYSRIMDKLNAHWRGKEG